MLNKNHKLLVVASIIILMFLVSYSNRTSSVFNDVHRIENNSVEIGNWESDSAEEEKEDESVIQEIKQEQNKSESSESTES